MYLWNEECMKEWDEAPDMEMNWEDFGINISQGVWLFQNLWGPVNTISYLMLLWSYHSLSKAED